MEENKEEIIFKRKDLDNKKADVVEKLLKDGRRYFGSSGASLTHQLGSRKYKDSGISPALAQVGLDGERKTTLKLKEWIKDKPNVVVVDSVHIKGHGEETLNEETGILEGGDTDHVIIIGNIVVILDSKNWKSKKSYSVDEDGVVLRSKKPFPGSNLKSDKAKFLWEDYLKNFNTQISSVVMITTEKVFVLKDSNWWRAPYRLITFETFDEFFNDVWKHLPKNKKNYINVDLITAVVVNAIKPYDPVKENLGEIAYLLRK